MAGLLDFLNGGDGSPQQPIDPRTMGLLGAIQAFGAANPPQAASRLPLAKPSLAYQLTQAMGGFGSGYGAGMQQQNEAAKLPYLQAQTAGANLQNINGLQNYNLWAPIMGVPTLTMSDLSGGKFDPKTMQQAVSGAPPPQQSATSPAAPQLSQGGLLGAVQGGAPAAPMPTGSPGLGTSGQTPAPMPAPAPMAGGMQDRMSQLYAYPPPILQKMGVTVPPEITQAWMAGYRPGTPEYQQIVTNAAINASGVKPVMPGERAGVPDKIYNPKTGLYDVPAGQFGPNGALAQGAFSSAFGSGQGALPSKESEAAFKAGLDVRVANETEKRKAFYSTGVMPPDYSDPMASAPVTAANGDVATPHGTIVPAPPKMQAYQGTDALNRQNATTEKTEENFGAIRGTLDGTEARLVALANTQKIVQGGGLNEQRAELANKLRGLGMGNIADTILSSKDTAAIQTALGVQTLDLLGQLKQINQGTGGKLLNSEFVNMLTKSYGPNLEPQANHDLITQALGGIYQTRNMIDDYYKVGKPGGWRDANAFQSAYWSKPQNSYQTMVDQAGKAIGPLKGMPGGPSTAKPLANAPSDADINHTAMIYSITPAQVRQKLGLPNAP